MDKIVWRLSCGVEMCLSPISSGSIISLMGYITCIDMFMQLIHSSHNQLTHIVKINKRKINFVHICHSPRKLKLTMIKLKKEKKEREFNCKMTHKMN